MDQSVSDLHRLLSRHAGGFTPEVFGDLIEGIIASHQKHAPQTEDDEDVLFELILDDILPEGADDALEGKVMLLLDDYFEIADQ